MKTLKECKDEIAQHYGFENWAAMFQRSDKYVVADYYSVASLAYAKQVAEQALEDAAEGLNSNDFHSIYEHQAAFDRILETPIKTP